MKNPKFSIIIPIFNVANLLTRTIKSALNQSYANIEIICVDDCSVDESLAVAESFAHKDSRIKILRNSQNFGTFEARNIGARSASGEYLLFLDGDDFLHADTCLKCAEVLQNANGGGGFR
ncbi:glycosyltransferase family 2 protein [Helicobacter sp. 23-1044]